VPRGKGRAATRQYGYAAKLKKGLGWYMGRDWGVTARIISQLLSRRKEVGIEWGIGKRGGILS